MALQHLRSSTAHKRPIPTVMSAGQIAINTNEASPAVFFKDSNGDLVKVGPVHIGEDAPNSSPASVAATALVTGTVYQILTVGTSDFTSVGASANTVGTIFTATGTTTGTGTVSGQQGVEKGEMWLDTTGGTYVLKIYDGSAWRSESGTFVDSAGDTMTGALGVVAGTASAPGVFFSGDTNTGLLAPAADSVAITTGGTQRIVVDSSGRLGLGTASPTQKVHIQDSSGPLLTFDDGTTQFGSLGSYNTLVGSGPIDTFLVSSTNGKSLVLRAPTSQTISFDIASSEAMRIDGSGNVLIGGTTASSADIALNANGNATFAGYVSAGDISITVDNKNGSEIGSDGVLTLQRQSSVGSGNAIQIFQGAGTQPTTKIGADGSATFAGDVIVSSANSVISTTDGGVYIGEYGQIVVNAATNTGSDRLLLGKNKNVSKFEVNADGSAYFASNVGIGTTSPSSALSIINNTSTTQGGIRIQNATGGNFAALYTDMNNFNYGTAGAHVFGNFDNTVERLRIDSSGRLLAGTSSVRSQANINLQAQVEGVGTAYGGLGLIENSNNTIGAYLILSKSRGTNAGSSTLVANNDSLGSIWFTGADGTDINTAAAVIKAEVDGTPGANNMPGRLVFSTTASGASSPTERMRIDSAGRVGINRTAPDNQLSIGSTASFHTDENSFYLGSNFTGTGSNFIATGKHAQRLFFNNASINGYLSYSNTSSAGTSGNAITWEERLRIDSAGNVGIGNSAPAYKLSVLTTGTSDTSLHLATTGGASDNGDATNSVRFTGGNNTRWANAKYEAFTHIFNANGAEKMRVDSAGRLGLGTTSPVQKLDVRGSVYVGDSIGIDNSSPSSYASDGRNLVVGSGSGSHGITIATGASNSGTIYFADGTSGTSLYTGTITYNHSSNYMAFWANATEAMRIDSAGRVGIGTSSPGSLYANKLVVDTGSAAQDGLTIKTGTTAQAMIAFADGTSGSDRYSGYIDYNHSTNALSFGTNGGSEKLRIDSAGRVGIGSTNPTSGKLTVVSNLDPGTTPAGIAVSMTGLGGGTATAQYGISVTGGGYNNSSSVYGVHSAISQQYVYPAYGGYFSSTGVYSQMYGIYAQATNGNANAANSVYAGYFKTLGSVAGTNGANYGVRIENAATNGGVSYGAYISTVAGATNVIPLRVDHAGTERMRIDSSGMVQISMGGSGYATLFRYGSNEDNFIRSGVNGVTAFGDHNGGERMRIDSSGNVGIGCSNPSSYETDRNDLVIGNATGNRGITISSASNGFGNIAFADTDSGTGRYAGNISYDHANNRMDFQANGAMRMRIRSDGHVLLGTTSFAGTDGLTLRSDGFIVAPPIYVLTLSASPRDIYMDSTGYFGYISSVRESKTNIQVQENVDWLYQLEPVTFNYKVKDRETGEYTGDVQPETEYGLIAEDVEAVCPELCFYDETDDGPRLSGIHYKKLITPMLKALQDAKSQIETLEQRLSDAGIA